MPKRRGNSDSESAEDEDFSEYSDEEDQSEQAESDAEPDEGDLVAHKPRKPQRPVAYEVPEDRADGEAGGEPRADGDRGLSESEGGLSGKRPPQGSIQKTQGGRMCRESGLRVVQNRAPAEGKNEPGGDQVLNEAVEEVKESGSDDGEVLGEIVECGEGEAPARPKAPPHKKKVLTKREYPSDSNVSVPDSPKKEQLPESAERTERED